MKTLKTFAEVERYLKAVRSFADQDKLALGFFAKAIFVEKAYSGKLWVGVDEETEECLGYLLFGGVFPSIKIFQLYVSPARRGQGIGARLVRQLVEVGEADGYLKISARVGADLPANKFWEHLGFNLVRQEPGGKSSGRTINIRVRDLDTPSLLKEMGLATGAPSTSIKELLFSRPISRSPTYVLDLNVFFDVIKSRVHRKEASSLMQAGFTHQITPVVTPEFVKELERHATARGGDPVLEFARTLPTLPEIDLPDVDQLRHELLPIVFPRQSQNIKRVEAAHSDLTHLVYCIHHRATGFVTRDKAILAAGDKLKQKYVLEVISPADIVQTDPAPHAPGKSLHAFYGEHKVSFAQAEEREREEVERFLKIIRVDPETWAIVWDPGSSGALRKRLTIRNEEQMIGVASWNTSSRFHPNVRLYFYLDEENPATDMVIDHVFETVFRDSAPFIPRRISLYTGYEQARTLETALERGFVKSFLNGIDDDSTRLTKFSFRGIVAKKDWTAFADDFRKATGLRLPATLPTVAEFANTGIPIRASESQPPRFIKLFDFETLVSPAVILCPGRTGLIVPIQARFANQLFSEVDNQSNLFPSKEAILRIEKAFFRSSRNAYLFDRGSPILFYQSGSGSMEVIGCGRISYSEVLPLEKVGVSLWRQGVLSATELKEVAKKSGRVHVFTFDNFNLFPKRIPYRYLRENRLISEANLVSVELLQPEQILRICRFGFGLEAIA